MEEIFRLRVDQDGIGMVTFNVASAAMNMWNTAAFRSFERLLAELEVAKGIRGVFFASGKADNFLAGADLKMIAGIQSEAEVREMLDLLHRAFHRLEALPFPSLAAIHGHCLGGGLEFALACTARLAKEGKTTILGLPECTVGLFPGGGGTQRLPRLIGYPAFELILKGSMLSAAQAHEAGIVDRRIPAEADLLREARVFLEEIIAGKAELKRPVHDFSQIDAVGERARQGILKATRGRQIPGPMLALQSLREGLKVSLEEGLRREKELFVAAALSREAKGSIHTFFLKGFTDKPRALMTQGFVPKPLKAVAVLGFGTMGRGIAIEILRNTQIPVLVKDIPEALEPGKAFVRKILEDMAEQKRLKEPVDAVMARLTTVSAYVEAFRDADLVVEAVFEDAKVKELVYGELCRAVREDCVIASNTSSIPIASLAASVAKPERFAGLHFFSPVWRMQLVEVIRGEETARETIDNLLHFAGLVRKRPIVCNDYPGFVVNALLFPNILRAFQYIEEGNPIEKVDQALTDFGMPVGPIRLTDEVGIDVPYKVFVGMGVPQDTLKKMVEAGRLGRKKSGKGFFLQDGSVDPEVLPLIARREPRERSPEEIQRGILEAMVRKGKELLDRKVVDDVRMIDAGMVWGIGFPTDKGGPMKWADLISLSERLFGQPFYPA